MIGRIDDPASMREASERLADAMRGEPYRGEPSPPSCNHASEYHYRYGGKILCRICEPSRQRDHARNKRLPEQLRNARARAEALERECKRKGIIV